MYAFFRPNYFAIAGLISGLLGPLYFYIALSSPLFAFYSAINLPMPTLGLSLIASPVITIVLSSIGLYQATTAPNLKTKRTGTAWAGLTLGMLLLLFSLCVLVGLLAGGD